MGLDPAVISLDAYATAKEFLLYADAIRAYMERGGVVAWGIVPAEYKIFATETVDSLYAKYREIRTQLTKQVPAELFDAQSLITPSCGSGSRMSPALTPSTMRQRRSRGGSGPRQIFRNNLLL